MLLFAMRPPYRLVTPRTSSRMVIYSALASSLIYSALASGIPLQLELPRLRLLGSVSARRSNSAGPPAAALGEGHDAARLDDGDEHDEGAVDQEVDGLARAAEIDARPLPEGDEDGRPDERAPEGADAAEHGHQADQDAQRGGKHRVRVDEEDVLRVEAAPERGEGGRQRHGPLLVRGHGDTQARRRVLVLADGAQVIAHARDLDLASDPECQEQEPEGDVVVVLLALVELEIHERVGALD